MLAFGLALAPAHPQGGDTRSWVKLCDTGEVGGNDEPGRPAEGCTTLTEQLHPGTGQLMVGVALRQAKRDGTEKNVLAVTVAPGVAIEKGAALTVLPPDLWRKVQRNGKLDTADETRLKPRTFKLSFKECAPTGCVAETEATPLLIGLLKDHAGLLVLTLRPVGGPVAQPVPLSGFAQALEGPPTDSKRFKEAREQLLKEIDARRQAQVKPSAHAGSPVGSATGSVGASSWVRVCDTGKLRGKMKDGSEFEKTVDMCMVTAESLHPKTGEPILVASLTHMKLDGKEKQVFSVVVPGALKLSTDATVAVLPADLWRKAKGKEKLDSGEESRLEASTVKLAVKFCQPVGCHAETEATPQLIDMLKGGAGLQVRTVGASGKRDTKLVSLDGFEPALSGPPTDPKAYKAARDQLVKGIVARQKEQKKREERAKRKESE